MFTKTIPNLKELFRSFTAQDYESGRVNLHVHTTYSDGKGDFRELAAQSKGYVAITDHNTVLGHIENPDCGVITGVEFDVWHKYIFLHLLAYGIDPKSPELLPFYAKDKRGTEKDIVRIFSRRNLSELINAIHKSGGIAVLAHPACCWALDMEKFVLELIQMGLDGIEVYYPYPRWRRFMRFAPLEKIERIADKYNLIKTGGTDCHGYDL